MYALKIWDLRFLLLILINVDIHPWLAYLQQTVLPDILSLSLSPLPKKFTCRRFLTSTPHITSQMDFNFQG